MLASLPVGLVLGFKQCGSSCDDEKFLILLSVIGLPIAGGVLGYYGGHHTVEAVIYRAPQPVADVLDEATWQRLRQTLPASLRGPERDPVRRRLP